LVLKVVMPMATSLHLPPSENKLHCTKRFDACFVDSRGWDVHYPSKLRQRKTLNHESGGPQCGLGKVSQPSRTWTFVLL
jgi:hypothetical protein